MVLESVSGLRGVYGHDLTLHYARKWAFRFGSYVGPGRVAIGRDTRPSSQALLEAAEAGLKASGCRVQSLGVVTTPEMFRYVRVEDIEGAVVVTASHNPPEWNGLKFVVRGGRGLYEEELASLREIGGSSKKGSSMRPKKPTYYEDILREVGEGSGSGTAIVVDLGGGSGCKGVVQLFRRLGADVRAINYTPGVFGRMLDPTEDPLEDLGKVITKGNYDVGFAFDGDADRLAIVDASGSKLPADSVLALMVLLEGREGGSLTMSVDTSSAVADLASRRGSEVILAPVGEANVVKAMIRSKSYLGGEGSSGGVIFPHFSYCRDGLLAAAILTKALKNRQLKELLDEIPPRCVLRFKLPLSRVAAAKALNGLVRRHPDAVTLDGVRLNVRRGWMLFRASRTEEAIRISVEGDNRKQAEGLLEEAKAMLEDALRQGM